MDKIKKLLTNISIFGISQFASKLLVFFMLPFYTAYLSKEEYGSADMVFTVVNLCLPLFTIQIYSAVLRFSMERADRSKSLFFNGLLVTAAGFALLLPFYPLLAWLHLFDGYIPLFYALYLCHALYNLLSNYARGVQHIKLVGVCGVVNTFVIVTCNVLFLAVFRFGVAGYLLASILGFLISSLVYLIALRKHISLRPGQFDRQDTRAMARYSLPLAPNSAAWWGVSSANKVVIQQYLSTGVLGLYSAATKFPTMIDIIQNIVAEGMIISVLDGYDPENPDVPYYSFLYRVYSTISILVVAGIIVMSRLMASILFSGEFIEAWRFVPFLCIPPLWGALSGFLGTFYAATKKNGGMFISTLLGAGISVAVSLIGVPRIGIYAIFIANIAAYFCIWLYRWIEIRRRIRLKVNMWQNAVSWLLLILLAALATFISDPGLLLWLDLAALAVILLVNLNAILEVARQLGQFLSGLRRRKS